MKKYIAIAVLMLAVILSSGCGAPSKTSTSTPAVNWDGMYYGAATEYGTELTIVGNSPSYSAVATGPCGESQVTFTTDSWDSSQTSNVTYSNVCDGMFAESQEWKLIGKTITITFTGVYSSNPPVVFTKQ